MNLKCTESVRNDVDFSNSSALITGSAEWEPIEMTFHSFSRFLCPTGFPLSSSWRHLSIPINK